MTKQKTIKKIASIVLSVLMVCSVFAISAGAASIEEPTIMPRWTSIYYMEVNLSFDGTTGLAGGSAVRQDTATYITGTLTVFHDLGDGDWEVVDSWTASSTRMELGISERFNAVSGDRYMAMFVVKAYTNGVPEQASTKSVKTCP